MISVLVKAYSDTHYNAARTSFAKFRLRAPQNSLNYKSKPSLTMAKGFPDTVIIVGAGVFGLSTALAIAHRHPFTKVTVVLVLILARSSAQVRGPFMEPSK